MTTVYNLFCILVDQTKIKAELLDRLPLPTIYKLEISLIN